MKLISYIGGTIWEGSTEELLKESLEFLDLRGLWLKVMNEHKAPLHLNQAIGMKVFESRKWVDEKSFSALSMTRQPWETVQEVSFKVEIKESGSIALITINPDRVSFELDDEEGTPGPSIRLPLWHKDLEDYEPPFLKFIEMIDTLYGEVVATEYFGTNPGL